MDHDCYDLHVLPPNPTKEQKDNPLVIENMTKDGTVEFLKRAIARKLQDPSSWSEINLYFIGEEMANHQKLGWYDLKDKDSVTAVTTIDVRQQKKPEIKKPAKSTATTDDSSSSESGGRILENLIFKFGSRSIPIQHVDLSTSFKTLREKVVADGHLSGYDIYFIYGSKKLEDDQLLEIYFLHESSTIHILERLRGGHGKK